jgi:hypothetical protein
MFNLWLVGFILLIMVYTTIKQNNITETSEGSDLGFFIISLIPIVNLLLAMLLFMLLCHKGE